jgi:hypothetical protein
VSRSPYAGMWARLMANIDEPENDQACWPWTGKRDRLWYGRLNVYVPGLAATKTVMAHVAAYITHAASPRTVDEFWLAYVELQASGLEVDHLCVTPTCISVDHLEAVTPSENCKRRNARRTQRVFAPAVN